MRRRALCGLTALCLSLSGCGPLVNLSSASGEIVTNSGRAADQQSAADRAMDQSKSGAANAGGQVGPQTGGSDSAGLGATADVMTRAGTLFSDTNGQVTEWSVEKQTAFETTVTELKVRYETVKPQLTPELAADFEGRFRSLDDRLKDSAMAASVATLQAVQREGSELVSLLGDAELDLARTGADASASSASSAEMTVSPTVEPAAAATPEAVSSGSVNPSASPSPSSQ